MSNLRLEIYDLNNSPLVPTGRIDGINEFSVTIREDSDEGMVASTFSSELTFYDDAYQVIYNALINNPTGFNERLLVKVYDDCCKDAVFEGYIRGDAIDWCESDCSVTANIVEDNKDLNCIKNTLIWDNHNGFLNRNHFPVRYCIEVRPLFIQILISIIILVVYNIVYILIFPIIRLFLIVCNLIAGFTRILGGDPPDCSGLVDTFTGFDELGEIVVPCGFIHPSPYIRDYIKNVCDKCGLQFSSSIFNQNNYGGDYYYSVLMSAQVKKGKDPDSTDYRIIEDNKPVETLDMFLNQYLVPIFNAKWLVDNGILYFERKDYFLTNLQWIDSDQLLANGKIVDNKICWNWIDKERYAFGRYEWQRDGVDIDGNEAFNRFNDLVDWNTNPVSSAQKGEKKVSISASPSRYQQDGIEPSLRDLIGNIGNAILDIITRNKWSEWTNLMIMSQHTPFNYKFLRVDPGSNGEIKRYYPDSYTGGSVGVNEDKRYNYAFWFQERNNSTLLQNNLYDRFHAIDNPRLAGAVQYEFKFKFQFDCGQYKDFSFGKYVKLTRGGLSLNGKVQELSIDFNNRVIEVKGVA